MLETDVCHSYEDELALLCSAVESAGAIAKAAFIAGNSRVWDKSGNHPVTDADIAVNEHLRRVLKAARPGYGWLSEETVDDASRHACQRTFVVDPIDGTRAFIDGKDHFVVSVAIIEAGYPIAGVICNPMRAELFSAAKGQGAFCNGASMNVSERKQLKDCKMVGYPRKFRRLDFPDMNISVVNSMAYRMVLVAMGRYDATVSFTPKSDWDIAAADLICREAGALVTDLKSRMFRFDTESVTNFGVICSGPQLHDLLVEKISPLIEKFEKSDNATQDFKFMGTRQSDRLGAAPQETDMQLLHLVIGGELVDPNRTEFKDLKNVDFVGAYGNYSDARDAWKSAAQRTVDNAHMRYFVLHAHELIDPDKDGYIG